MSVLWNTCWPLNLQIRKRATLRRAATALELCCLSLVLWLVVDSFQVILRQTKRWTDSISLSVHHFIVCIGVTYFLPRSHREDLNDSFLKLSLLVWIWTFPISPHWKQHCSSACSSSASWCVGKSWVELSLLLCEEEEAVGDQAGEHSSSSLVLVVPLRPPPLPQLLTTLPPETVPCTWGHPRCIGRSQGWGLPSWDWWVKFATHLNLNLDSPILSFSSCFNSIAVSYSPLPLFVPDHISQWLLWSDY